MSRATTWACALLIALLLSTSHLLDGPTDTETAQAVADDLAQAQATAQADHGATKTIATTSAKTWASGQFDQTMASAKGAQL